jgi:hypothetical protein
VPHSQGLSASAGTPIRRRSTAAEAAIPRETAMSKDKGGRETKKPKAESNKKVKGQTPAPANAALDAIRPKK